MDAPTAAPRRTATGVSPLLGTLAALLLTATACSSNGGSTAAGGHGGGDQGGAGGSAASGGGHGGSGPTAGVSGTVQHTDGSPVAGAPIQLCADVCYLRFTGDSGAFSYPNVPAGHYKLDVRGPTDAALRYGAVNFPIDLAADDMLVIEQPLFLPVTGDGTPLAGGVQAVSLDAELSLTVDGAALQYPLGAEGDYLAGIRVMPEHAPPNTVLRGSAAAWWALNPFGTLSASPIGLAVGANLTSELGLSPGMPIDVYTLSDQTGELVLDATTSVQSNGIIELTGGDGLSQISWIVLATPAASP